MTGGGPGRASFVMVLYIYIKGMQEGELGYASALSVIFFCVLMLVTCLLRLLLRDREQESRNEVKLSLIHISMLVPLKKRISLLTIWLRNQRSKVTQI